MKFNQFDKINEIIEKKELDAFLLISPENRLWFSKYNSTAGFILITKNTTYLLLDGRYYEDALSKKNIINADKIILINDYYQGLLNVLQELDIHKIGFEGDKITFYQGSLLNKIDDNLSFLPVNLEKIREIKTFQEYKYVKKAAEITDRVFAFVKESHPEGLNEIQLANKINEKFYEYGADGLAFDTIVASGQNSAYPHHRPTNRIIKKGDNIIIDIGCRYKGYCSDMTRTFFVGTINPEIHKIYDIVLEAQKSTIGIISLGVSFSKLDGYARNIIAKYNYSKYFNHGTGHGLGIEVHEEPYVVAKNIKDSVSKGMIFTIEPGIYIPGVGGVRIEDDIYIDSNGKSRVIGQFTKKYCII